GEPDGQGDFGEREAALHAHEEDAVLDWRHRVERVDDAATGIQLDDTADQRRVQFAAEKIAMHRHADRSDVDDRELTGKQLADVNLYAVNGAREAQAGNALESNHLGRQGQDEVSGVLLDVGPLDADGSDADWQPARPLEGVARRRADTDDDAEAWLRL